MRRPLVALAPAFLFIAAMLNAAVSSEIGKPSHESPTVLIATLGDSAIRILKNDSLAHQEKIDQFDALLSSAFDWEQVGAYSLGEYRDTIEPAQFDEYRDVFSRYMVKIYAAKMAAYSGESFIITGEKQFLAGHSEVRTEVRGPTRSPIPIMFLLDRDETGFKVHDVIIEGVSLLATKREEVTSVIARGGIGPLIAKLKQSGN
ncbi:MAG: ABC transporter substrate-binding protein [Alphaproteobacteria bacterium]